MVVRKFHFQTKSIVGQYVKNKCINASGSFHGHGEKRYFELHDKLILVLQCEVFHSRSHTVFK